MANKISHIRKDYKFAKKTNLFEKDVSRNPYKQFLKWFEDALTADPMEANAMFLGTSTPEGRPSVRTVLLKGFDNKGFTFYTNYDSRKGRELAKNPYASILFFWKELGRQIRIEGKVSKVTRKESEKYFHSRPADSQLAALSSNQSRVIRSRNELEEKFFQLKLKYKDKKIPLPETWGGYRLAPVYMEFWQGRQNRLHDRIIYKKAAGNKWKISRLSP